MLNLEPHFDIQNKKVFENHERRSVRSNFIFYVPFPLLLNPDDEFEICLPKNPEKKHLLRVISRDAYTLKRNHKFLGYDQIEEQDELNFVMFRNGDRFGITGYSRVLVSYDRFIDIFDSENSLDINKIYKSLEMVCDIFNYFLDIYGAVVKHRQVMKISPQDLHTLDFNHSTDKQEIFNQTRCFALHGATVMNVFVSPNQMVSNRIKELLGSGNPYLSFCGLGVNAVRHLFGGEYLSAIVQAVTQLESFLYAVYREKFLSKSINEVNRILMSLGLSNLVEMVPVVLSSEELNIVKSKVNLAKVSKAISIRNKYIHEGTNAANINSLLIAEEYVNEINRLCVELAKLIGVDHPLDEEKNGW
jgi:hypothetical protein